MKRRPYSKAIESGIWYNHETGEHDYEAFFDSFAKELLAAPLEGKAWVMRDYGIWWCPQR
jgi:hypothetical protein